MAILQSTGIRGFLVSAKRTGNKILNSLGKSVDEYVENFLSGFSGYGWKLWEYTNGKYKLELDALTVRGTFSVYELLVQKIRAVKGALGITQGNGKIKTVTLSENGFEYLITLEDEMSFAENDFIRCQTFNGSSQKLYHVLIRSISDSNTVIHLSILDFEADENGTIINPPEAGDEIVQFGNSEDTTRQSAIYLHADEGGQPAIDVMFGINSTNWSNNVKIRIGGEIPGSGGLKGFYCVNGMVKGVNESGHTTYCIYPDGSAMFGDGSAQFNADKSGYLAGGAISWQWDATANKYRTTMGDVILQWGNLSSETQDNLKGEKGDKGDTGNPGTPGENGTDGADGINGTDGENGSIVVRFEWAIGVQCMANSIIPGQTSDANKYLSVAMVRDNSLSSGWRAYRCLQPHITAVGNAPGNTDYWTEFDVNLSSVFTSLIVAKNASIEFLSGNELRILDTDGDVAAGISGSGTGSSGIRFFAGGSNPQTAPWRVNELGESFSETGYFKKLSCTNEGQTQVAGSISFGDDGNMWFDGDLYHQGTKNGRSLRNYTSDVWVRGAFGARLRTVLTLNGNIATYYPNGLSADGVSVTLTAKTTSGGQTYYEPKLYGDSGDYSGMPVDEVVFIGTSNTYYNFIMADTQRVLLVNANQSLDGGFSFYSNGNVIPWVGGTVGEIVKLSSLLINPVPGSTVLGRGILYSGRNDNDW